MARKCVLPGCYYSNSASNSPKIGIFRVSTDIDTLLSWQTAIDASNPPKQIALKSKQRICERHFAKGDVLTHREVRGSNGELLRMSLRLRKGLRAGAVPSIFPWTNSEPEETADPTVSDSTMSEDPSSTGCP